MNIKCLLIKFYKLDIFIFIIYFKNKLNKKKIINI